MNWVADRFGVSFTSSRPELVELALRRNPRRAHLLVSTVLGKHVPARPEAVRGAGCELGRRVREVIGDASAVVLGYAETATGLGHCVAETLSAPYLHSTRRAVPTVAPYAGFEESHSHATSHLLLPAEPGFLEGAEVLVLVDDELSTGATALHTIEALHAIAPRGRYVLAALLDARSGDEVDTFAARLGVRIDVVALATGSITWPDGFPAAAAEFASSSVPTSAAGGSPDVVRHDDLWPAGVRESGRHGIDADGHAGMRRAASIVAASLAGALPGGPVLVLGTEELMWVPLLVGEALAARGVDVRVSSTTRSPVVVVDEPGYPIRSAVRFSGEDGGERFAYNTRGFAATVLVTDTEPPAELLAGLDGTVHVVRIEPEVPLPAPLHGPAFGSYRADEVSWLLTDLSGVELEAPTEEREEAIQSGGAHYAESLPVEYQPDASYRALFDAALDEAAGRIAHAVGVVTEIVLAERGRDVVLASLARAGTPVGILMRRWAGQAHGLDLAHRAVSIVRGRGIDTVALRWLATHHDPDQVVFVDGWTGKGAIARELAAAVDEANKALGTAFDPSLAVLADPGHCVDTFGTREDFLVPSACLNSTVSGLVSRTVLNPAVLAPGQFHGAKFYRELGADDVSGRFLDVISERFPAVAADVARDWPGVCAGERLPTWAGWAEVERLSTEYGIGDVTLVKPGVGETTRVLLRRVPWAVLVRTGADLPHIRLLAEQRGVPIREVDGLTYSCVGLIHPRYTRGATGADGTAVR